MQLGLEVREVIQGAQVVVHGAAFEATNLAAFVKPCFTLRGKHYFDSVALIMEVLSI